MKKLFSLMLSFVLLFSTSLGLTACEIGSPTTPPVQQGGLGEEGEQSGTEEGGEGDEDGAGNEGSNGGSDSGANEGGSQGGQEPLITFYVSSPVVNQTIAQNNQWFSSWENAYSLNNIASVKNYAQGNEMFAPTGVNISWTQKQGAEFYVLEVSTSSNFESVATEKYYGLTTTEYTVNNLIPNKTYYTRVSSRQTGVDNEYTPTVSFKIADEIRVVYIDGVSNSRDLGGKAIGTNQRVKYGMVYRTANADGISATGLATIEKLGVKTEIDLRGKQTATVLGDGIQKFIAGDMPQYHELKWVADGSWANGTDETNKAKVTQLKTVFQSFADQSNYPVLYHCQIGRDRTGTVSMLLLALLGASEKDIYLDYEASFYSRMCCWDSTETSDKDGLEKCLAQLLSTEIDTANANFPINNSNNFYATVEWLKSYSNNGTLKTGAERLLKSIGITDNEILQIRQNLLETI